MSSALNTCLKGLAAIALIAASPVLIVFVVPFGCGMAGDVMNAAGTPAALAFTTGDLPRRAGLGALPQPPLARRARPVNGAW